MEHRVADFIVFGENRIKKEETVAKFLGGSEKVGITLIEPIFLI
jgi:hypothetical protein